MTNLNTTAQPTDTTTFQAVSINAKLAASVVTQAVGYTVGAFVSVADTAQSHANANPDGYVAKSLHKTIKTQYQETRDVGYKLTEEFKDLFDFDDKPETTKGDK